MNDPDFEARAERVERAAGLVAKFATPELQTAALEYLLGGMAPLSSPRDAGTPDAPVPRDAVEKAKRSPASDEADPATKGRARTNGKKQSFNFDRELDFYAKGARKYTPFKDFVLQHWPANAKQKVVVAVYWLAREHEVEAVKIDMVYTAFKTMEWMVPADLANTLQQAGHANYLDSRKRDDLKITTHGENLVEHELKPKSTE